MGETPWSAALRRAWARYDRLKRKAARRRLGQRQHERHVPTSRMHAAYGRRRR